MSENSGTLVFLGWDIAPYLPTILSLSFVVIGWGVIYRNAKKLSSRNEVHAFANNIVAILKEIETLSEEFWFKSVYNDSPISYEMLVISKIKVVQQKLTNFSETRIKIEELDDFIFKLRKSCTGKSSLISKLSQADKRDCMNQVINSISTLEFKLTSVISKKYPHS